MTQKLARVNPVSIELDQKRKLVFRHKELRDLTHDTKRTIVDLFNDTFGGWPYLLQYGLRYQDNRITLDQASDMIDLWVESHKDERYPLKSLGETLMEALNASGMIKLEAEGVRDENVGAPEGNAQPESSSPIET